MSVNDQALQDLEAGAYRILDIVRRGSPGVTDVEIFKALSMASGLALANAVYPDLPSVSHTSGCASLHCWGVLRGREARTKLEKESCQGVA